MPKNIKTGKALSLNQALRRHGNIIFAKHAALKRYRNYPNVIGIGIGTKFKRDRSRRKIIRKLSGIKCIQFFVKKKPGTIRQRWALPKFVFGRSKDGALQYSSKIPTDVIEVGAIRRVCSAGSQVDSNTEHGLMSLIFVNKANKAKKLFLLSCAHVIGDIGRTP